MNIKFSAIIFLSLAFSLAGNNSLLAQSPNKALLKTINQDFIFGTEQYKLMMKLVPDSLFPKTYHGSTNKIETSNSAWWCSGFYPGTLLYLFGQTKDSALYHEAFKKLYYLQKEQYNTSTHDLGFMMYCSFGNAIRQFPETKASYDRLLMNSARSLATRFNPVVGCIKSWDSKPGEFLVIIDNMMNLELLFWATRYSGDSSFYKIAVTHANTTLKNHFRAGNSSYHVINYNPLTGTVISKRTAQGAADSSAWARGQAWGLYGFTEVYRETKDKQYLEQAKKIAAFIITHPDFPADKIPYWDFNAPGIPNALRDVSAGAIIASALLELSTYVDKADAQKYYAIATQIIQSLSSKKYRSSPGANAGFILQHGVGHKPAGSEVDVPLSYADYYFIEALQRVVTHTF